MSELAQGHRVSAAPPLTLQVKVKVSAFWTKRRPGRSRAGRSTGSWDSPTKALAQGLSTAPHLGDNFLDAELPDETFGPQNELSFLVGSQKVP